MLMLNLNQHADWRFPPWRQCRPRQAGNRLYASTALAACECICPHLLPPAPTCSHLLPPVPPRPPPAGLPACLHLPASRKLNLGLGAYGRSWVLQNRQSSLVGARAIDVGPAFSCSGASLLALLRNCACPCPAGTCCPTRSSPVCLLIAWSLPLLAATVVISFFPAGEKGYLAWYEIRGLINRGAKVGCGWVPACPPARLHACMHACP